MKIAKYVKKICIAINLETVTTHEQKIKIKNVKIKVVLAMIKKPLKI